MDPIYEAYRSDFGHYYKVNLEVLEGPMKGNTKKWTRFEEKDLKKWKVGDTIEVNVQNNKSGEGDLCKITKITKEKF